MRNTVLSYLLLPLFATLPLTLHAAQTTVSQPVVATATQSTELQTKTSRIDLNKADALTLQHNLNGIGKAKAEAIVAYREANGPFDSVDELLEIKGIGSALVERNREKLTVD
ncbi:competence protein ComEA [Pseudomonas putida]|uniref:ComEA family DNA-binding protein n=1 Tax=Pseudomonas putida TaxID=303 RepID=UPI0007B6F6DB|nr:ComEA family DNA-binding protein [Pseudomonas putida]ANC04442.1 competence protein ComEA [Pseudomonas putida]